MKLFYRKQIIDHIDKCKKIRAFCSYKSIIHLVILIKIVFYRKFVLVVGKKHYRKEIIFIILMTKIKKLEIKSLEINLTDFYFFKKRMFLLVIYFLSIWKTTQMEHAFTLSKKTKHYDVLALQFDVIIELIHFTGSGNIFINNIIRLQCMNLVNAFFTLTPKDNRKTASHKKWWNGMWLNIFLNFT